MKEDIYLITHTIFGVMAVNFGELSMTDALPRCGAHEIALALLLKKKKDIVVNVIFLLLEL